jgi:hypothetical protein
MPRCALLLLVALLLGGCASRPLPAEFVLEPGQYADTFTAGKEVLRRLRFELDRVDARAGVITSRPKDTAGFATPWDAEQTTVRQLAEDFWDNQQRRVRITFEPRRAAGDTGAGGGGAAAADTDVREATGPIVARVEVVIDRINRPGRRIDTTAIRYSTHTQDVALTQRGMYPQYAVPWKQDELLAGRLAEKIRRRVGIAAPAEPGVPAPGNKGRVDLYE